MAKEKKAFGLSLILKTAKLWGDTWTGRAVVLYCDNDAVCEVIWHKKPRDQRMLSLLREFLFVVVTKKFHPVVTKISTTDNLLVVDLTRQLQKNCLASLDFRGWWE